MLSPLALMLLMFFHHFASLSQQPYYYQFQYFRCREVPLVCMATEHICFVNPYCSCVLSDNLYPIHSIIAISIRHQQYRLVRHPYVIARNLQCSAVIGANLRMRQGAVMDPRTGLCTRYGCDCAGARPSLACAWEQRFRALSLRTFSRLHCAGNAKI